MVAGIRNEKKGYESLIEAASSATRRFDPEDQQALVIQALKMAFPRSVLKMVRLFFFFFFGTLVLPWVASFKIVIFIYLFILASKEKENKQVEKDNLLKLQPSKIRGIF